MINRVATNMNIKSNKIDLFNMNMHIHVTGHKGRKGLH